jgi:hypothetical protein
MPAPTRRRTVSVINGRRCNGTNTTGCAQTPPTVAVGDKTPWGRDELTVSVLDPPRALALSMDAHGMEWVWQFGLYPLDDHRTRLVDRGTERIPKTLLWWLGMRIMEPAAFIMTRRFMLGVKQRAETLTCT